jgi:hypothetical protein
MLLSRGCTSGSMGFLDLEFGGSMGFLDLEFQPNNYQTVTHSFDQSCGQFVPSAQDSTHHHPETNGTVERATRQLKNSIQPHLMGDKWPEQLPRAL